jgi:hypothetical protein
LVKLETLKRFSVIQLVKSHHPIHFEDLGVPEEQARSAFRNGYLMRDRFSIADHLNFIVCPAPSMTSSHR